VWKLDTSARFKAETEVIELFLKCICKSQDGWETLSNSMTTTGP